MPSNPVELVVLVRECLTLEKSLNRAFASLEAALIMANSRHPQSRVVSDCQTEHERLRSQYNAQASQIIKTVSNHPPTFAIGIKRSYSSVDKNLKYEVWISAGGSLLSLKEKPVFPGEATAYWICALMLKPQLYELREKRALAESIAPSEELIGGDGGYDLVTIGSTRLWLERAGGINNQNEPLNHLFVNTNHGRGLGEDEYKQVLQDLGCLEERGATIRINIAPPYKMQSPRIFSGPTKV